MQSTLTKDPNAQFDNVEIIRGKPTIILEMEKDNGTYEKFDPPHELPAMSLYMQVEKLGRKIERRLTHEHGYDANSTMREESTKPGHWVLFPSKLSQYALLKEDLKEREQKPAWRNVLDHLRGKYI